MLGKGAFRRYEPFAFILVGRAVNGYMSTLLFHPRCSVVEAQAHAQPFSEESCVWSWPLSNSDTNTFSATVSTSGHLVSGSQGLSRREPADWFGSRELLSQANLVG